ncbi:ABC transporter ATP-binding protein [Bradyrhizobium sp. UFLA03-84]|uniref:ABC transporter ATP-binding protein n=1 Tax=Bradyrhizobium sp. UFLA03-84 TaxID=418599 RepID=UPI000BAE0AD5|nr:ABC transporter ATP-binding protein [Bradyrhizobium sp. UFLA03-84]PAY06483.1 ABC transporter ATP-binding protein [Bradyrhizobium sp. UFLA03-84]
MLEVRNITKRFGNLVAVKDVSMSVKTGELRAIIGPNGAGKTTFFNMISGYFPPTKGSILFQGEDVTHVPAHQRVALAMGRTFQITEVFPELTVHENVLTAAEVKAGQTLHMLPNRADAKLANDVAAEMLALVGLTAKADRLVGELSHGDQRTTEIAMALAQLPRLLLLDEPTAGMGDQETYEITTLIRRLHRERNYTIVLIEHDMRVVFHLADYITVLDQGGLLAEGKPDEIAASEAVQAAYLGESR